MKTETKISKINVLTEFSSCAYCGKLFPTESMYERKIVKRGRKMFGICDSKPCLIEKLLKFCSKTCAAYEKMSSEG